MNHAARYRILALVSTLAVGPVSSCSDYACACSPPAEPVPGTYHATRLRFTPTGQATIDALAGGASLTITLTAAGTTSGTFIVPASLNNGSQATFDLTGTYQVASYVTFSHAADTFIRDLNWTRQEPRSLTTNESAGGVQYDVVLTKQ